MESEVRLYCFRKIFFFYIKFSVAQSFSATLYIWYAFFPYEAEKLFSVTPLGTNSNDIYVLSHRYLHAYLFCLFVSVRTWSTATITSTYGFSLQRHFLVSIFISVILRIHCHSFLCTLHDYSSLQIFYCLSRAN